MTEQTVKHVESILNYVKGEIFRSVSDEDAILYSNWIKSLILDTIKNDKEFKVISEIKKERAKESPDFAKIKQLKTKKKKYEHQNYNHNLQVGDIVYVNYGYGYCGELSTGHYGIIMSDIVNNMYFVVTLSSDPLNDYEYYLEGLNLPNAEGDKNKKSYVRFEQSRFMHFRRLTNISVNGLQIYRKLTPEQVKDVKKHFSEFMKLSIDKEEK